MLGYETGAALNVKLGLFSVGAVGVVGVIEILLQGQQFPELTEYREPAAS